ncbi:uncharacterized protein LOC143148213 [Ptiloglossa arizonensis]|uniref:uncharacterized protein LOC143148213 n=1 Tax=Ptiloglossa arizonensis TaxID=3350558 RepID=UPI003F9F6458
MDNNIEEEDEDIVIQGSSLYEHLHNLGYTEFETVVIPKSTLKNKERNFKLKDFIHSAKNVFKKLFVVYLGIIQDDNVSKKQVGSILNAKVLLNDHVCTIHEWFDRYNCKSWRTVLLKFVLLGAILSHSMYIPFSTQYKNVTNSFALFTLFWVSYIEYSRVHAYKNLESVVSLQNDLFDLYKKGLKILKYGYKIKLNKRKHSQEFNDLIADRLKYLQPITENLVKCLEHASCTYYHVSLILKKLLPMNVFHEDLLTRFEIKSFGIRGEINYQKLKNLYHIYVLTQSEMLHLLAIAYNSHTWKKSYSKIPELKLAYIIHFLIQYLTIYKNKLSKIIDAYYTFKAQPTSYKYRGSTASHWQDVYMHLYLASNKLQLAYGHILSILQDIDNNVNECITHDSVENTMKKLNEVKNNIETAKGFVEYSSLFLVRKQIDNTDPQIQNILIPVENSNISIVHDSEPEIMDEVFEEYITNEHSKSSSEECDEISLHNSKQDTLLFKNFMVELKDALIEKQTSMSKRESKALQRMQKNIMNGITSHDQHHHHISTHSPISSFNIPSTLEQKQIITDQACNNIVNRSSEELKIDQPILESKTELKEDDLCNALIEEKSSNSTTPLQKNEFSFIFPKPFLKINEETFTSSGENSEDEVIETEKED